MFARTRMFVKTSAVVFIFFTTGCSGMRFDMSGGTAPPRPQPTGAMLPQVAEAPEPIRSAPPSQSTVAAIEEFLERTQGYARPPVEGEDATLQPRTETGSERSTLAAPSWPARGMRSPSVDITGVTQGQGEVATRGGYHWSARPVTTDDPRVDPAPQAAGQLRPATTAPATYDVRRQPSPNLASDRMPVQAVAATETHPRMLALPVLQSVSISAASEPDLAIASDSGMSNVPVEIVAQPARPAWQTLIEELTEQAESRGDVLAYWRLGLARLASDQIEGGPMAMPGLSAEPKSLLEALFSTAASVRDQLVDPESSGTRTLEHVESLHRKIASAADPVVSAVALCRRVTTFGVFEEMDPTDLVAGRAAQIIVYCELDNLKTKMLDDGRFETNLATRVEVLTSDGRSVWSHEEPQIVDQCRRRRRDFFLAQRLTMPATLPAGEYVLKVLVEDLATGRTNEAIEPFVISSALSLAERGQGGQR